MKREAFSWSDMSWIRALWKGPIVINGVFTAEDARRSLDNGAAAVVVPITEAASLMVFQPACKSCRKLLKKSKIRQKSSWTAGFAADQTS